VRTLVLNAGYEPLHTVSWQRAVCLIFTCKAEVVEEYSKLIRSVSSVINLPKVIRLTNYVTFFRNSGFAKCNRKNILLRDKYTCQYCGVSISGKNATIDHIVPKSKGGSSDFLNLVACCQLCNNKKGDKFLNQLKMRLKTRPYVPRVCELGGFQKEAIDYLRRKFDESA
jgi:5-methylcytosine-specific restriction endonuclease McrA